MTAPTFLFVTCQVGAEATLKKEIDRLWPEFRPAYARPGFLTFKLPEDFQCDADFELGSLFARTYGLSLGKATGQDAGAMAKEVWQLAGDLPIKRLHVWQRDLVEPSNRRFSPGPTELSELVTETIRRARPAGAKSDETKPAETVSAETTSDETTSAETVSDETVSDETASIETASVETEVAQRGQHVLDVVIVEPGEWWVGHHRAGSLESRWPGGIRPIEMPEDAVSRAYLKMSEALWWSRFPIQKGTPCAELGCSPGGSSQALLDAGAIVMGIDPAEVDPLLLEHPNFTYVRKRGKEVRRREFASSKFLIADMNVVPGYTLDAVEGIVTHKSVNLQGLLLTLKLTDWKLAEQLPELVDRVRSWGFREVRVRQLCYNRQEVCLAALKHRSLRRLLSRGSKRRRPQADVPVVSDAEDK